MDFALTEEQRHIQALARRFAREVIAPAAAECDRTARFPHAIVEQARALGLVNLLLPVAYGGTGATPMALVVVAEELAWACTGIAAAILLNNLVADALTLAGTEAQRKAYGARLAEGLGAYALTAGRARLRAASQDGAAGLQRGGSGVRRCGVGAGRLAGGRGQWVSLGHARLRPLPPDGGGCRRRPGPARPRRGAGLRRGAGGLWAKVQGVGFKLAEIGMRAEAARLLTRQAAWKAAVGAPNTLEAAYAKAFAADTAMWAAVEAVQVFGAYGYSAEYPVEKLMRDAKVLQIYEGTNEIQRTIMVRELARRAGATLTNGKER